MSRLWLMVMILGIVGCVPTPWAWQDTRTPARSAPEADLAACRSYASSQYSPGLPAGDPYLKDFPAQSSGQGYPDNQPGAGVWHPDREPFPYTNRDRDSLHGVVVPYTGYPGELDYHPDYLDALVEKCMADRGWAYRPVDRDHK